MEHNALHLVNIDFAVRLGVALAIGALIGLERERHRDGRTVLAGIRTYPLVALAGVLFTTIGEVVGNDAYIAVGAVIFAVFSAILYWVRHNLGVHGITSPIAFFLTYGAGALVGLGLILEGVLTGIAIAILLFTKAHLHRLADVLTEDEMSGALQFLVIAFILYPILPEGAIDPWGIIQPRRLVLIVLFVSAIGFVSFLVMRTLGTSRGLAASSLLGGLVNSEATTASLAGLAQEHPTLGSRIVAGIHLTNATMLLRNLAIAAFVAAQPALLIAIGPALVAMFIVQSAMALKTTHPGLEENASIRLGNPFALKPGLAFAVMFLILQAVSFGLARIPGMGDLPVLLTALGGLISSAAVVASVASLAASGALNLDTAAATAVLATVVSTLNKLFVVRGVAPVLLRRLRPGVLVPATLGVLVLAVTHFLF